MLRLKAWSLDAMHRLTDDIERRLRRLEGSSAVTISGYTMTYIEDTGKLTLTNGDKVVTFTKD